MQQVVVILKISSAIMYVVEVYKPRPCSQTTPVAWLAIMRSVSRRLLENALADHLTNTQQLKYSCDIAKLPRDVASKFIQLRQDEETTEFIDQSRSRAGNFCLQLLYTFLQVILGMFLSQTSINGLLHRGQMFVFSKDHLRSLFSSSFSHCPTLLDIGAGDGAVTAILEQILSPSAVHVTETSPVMQRRLTSHGYQLLDVKSWPLTNPSYGVIACLNVLDRCERPLSLLHLLHQHLAPGGLLLLALVLPYDPFVEKGPRHVSPSEFLPVDGAGWEEEVTSLLQNQLLPMGFELHAVTRLPYLCEGDSSQDYYSLDDVVVVLRKPPTNTPAL